MTSVVSAGTTERMIARTFDNVVLAGSGTRAIYSSIVLGAFTPMRAPRFDFFLAGNLIPRDDWDLTNLAFRVLVQPSSWSASLCEKRGRCRQEMAPQTPGQTPTTDARLGRKYKYRR